MQTDTKHINPALVSLINNPSQVVFLDANFFIPPDRSCLKNIKPYSFESFKNTWLIPLFEEFSELSVHESVFDELVDIKVKEYASSLINKKLKIYRDSELNKKESAMKNYYMQKLSKHSAYDPVRDNAKDRGEIKTLSFMAVKKYLYFAANDALPIRLIKYASELNTGLDDMEIIQMYELIFYLYSKEKYDSKNLRLLYKYQYYLSPHDKLQNPGWDTFIEKMSWLYRAFC